MSCKEFVSCCWSMDHTLSSILLGSFLFACRTILWFGKSGGSIDHFSFRWCTIPRQSCISHLDRVPHSFPMLKTEHTQDSTDQGLTSFLGSSFIPHNDPVMRFCCYPHFREWKSKPQRGYIASPGSHSLTLTPVCLTRCPWSSLRDWFAWFILHPWYWTQSLTYRRKDYEGSEWLSEAMPGLLLLSHGIGLSKNTLPLEPTLSQPNCPHPHPP